MHRFPMTASPYARSFAAGLLAILLGSAAAPACAGTYGEVRIVDRVTGATLSQIHQHGRTYVAGEPGHAYEIVFRNRTGGRLMAVMSVDGVNVLSGETASTGQIGYVYGAYEQAPIRGWRKSLDDVARFEFTALPKSYAARTGRPDNVGVIGVALFREALPEPPPVPQPHCCLGEREPDRDASASAAGDVRGRSAAGLERPVDSAAARSTPPAPSAPLGTGHGARETSVVGTTTFERASPVPDEVITIHYDSRPNLIAAGILPEEFPRLARRSPQAFPGGFVPDP